MLDSRGADYLPRPSARTAIDFLTSTVKSTGRAGLGGWAEFTAPLPVDFLGVSRRNGR